MTSAVKMLVCQWRLRPHRAFAIAFLFRDEPDLIVGARMGAPLTVGYGDGENYLGSDALAVAPWTQRIAYLDEGDWAVIRREQIEIFDRNNQPVEREIVESGASSAQCRARGLESSHVVRRRRGESSPAQIPGDAARPPVRRDAEQLAGAGRGRRCTRYRWLSRWRSIVLI